MKKNTYTLNTVLAMVLGAALLAAVLVRTFAPRIIIAELDVPNMVLISLVALVVALVDGILTALAMIPIIGIVFALATLALAALAPLFTGLIQAAFYEEIKNPTIPVTTGAAAPAVAAFCPNCGSAMDAGAKFCPRCGQQIG